MKNLRKLITGITLLLFMGQSFASLKMACEFSSNSGHESGNSQHLNLGDRHEKHSNISTDNHYHNQLPGELSFQQISSLSGCDAEKTKCPCSMGTCSVYYLPTSNYNLDFTYKHDQLLVREDFSSHQPSLLFRPPITA